MSYSKNYGEDSVKIDTINSEWFLVMNKHKTNDDHSSIEQYAIIILCYVIGSLCAHNFNKHVKSILQRPSATVWHHSGTVWKVIYKVWSATTINNKSNYLDNTHI